MAVTEKIICITCPKGCTLEVTHDGGTVLNVKNGCSRGKKYVQAELVDPRRMVATTVNIQNAEHPLLPVYTSEPFPKPMIKELLKTIRQTEVNAPVQMGDTIIENVLGTGINILASRDFSKVE